MSVFSPSALSFLEGSHNVQTTLGSGEVCFTSLRPTGHKLCGILPYGRFVSSLPVVVSFISAWTQLFSSLGYSPILVVYFIAQIALALALGNISGGSSSL